MLSVCGCAFNVRVVFLAFAVVFAVFAVAPLASAGSEIMVDNAPAGVQDVAGGRTYTGRWCVSQTANFYGSNSLYSCGTRRNTTYRWTPNIATAGAYDVYVWWSAALNRSSRVPIRIVHAAGSATKNFNERSGGGTWVLHGRYNMNAGKAGYVEVSAANGPASADAIRLVAVDAVSPPPPPPPPPPSGAGDGPAILFTDVNAGPNSGGPGGLGVPIAIFGKGFGASRGTSKVTINAVEVASYVVWGQNNANNTALDMIVVQPGAAVTAGPIVVTVNGKSSNADQTFAPTTGKVYYVAPTGSDAAPCSESQPCATVLYAVTSVMQAGDAVLIRGGILNDNEVWIRGDYGHSGQPGKPKIVRNYPGEVPVFSTGDRPFIIDANYITLSGVQVQNGKPLVVGYETSLGNRLINNTFRGAIGFDALGTHGNDILVAGNDCNVPSSTVGTQGHCYYISNGSNIRLLYNIGRGAPGYGIHIFDQNRTQPGVVDIQRVISNVLVEGNLLAASPERSGMIIAMADEGGRGNYIDGVTIRNNIFTANNFAGIAVGGIVRNVKIYHNTFYRNGRQGVTLYDEATVNGIEIFNNLFDQTDNTNCKIFCEWYQPAHIQKGAAAQNVVISNNFYAPGPAIIIGGADSAAAIGDPGFVNGAAGNFDLASGSVAIDKGMTLPTVTRDFNGRPRPLGLKPDPGAFEFRP